MPSFRYSVAMREFLATLLLLAGSVAASPAVAQDGATEGSQTPPVIVDCAPGPYIIFFAPTRIEISPAAAAILDNAIVNFRDCWKVPLVVAGHTDRSGPNGYNLALSRRRAVVVAHYLAARGIAAEAIRILARGEGELLVRTRDGVPEAQNRRVEISPDPDRN